MDDYTPTHDVLVTSLFGSMFVTDVIERPNHRIGQMFSTLPVTLTDPTYAYAWACDSALNEALESGIRRRVWHVMDGVVTDFYDTHQGRP